MDARSTSPATMSTACSGPTRMASISNLVSWMVGDGIGTSGALLERMSPGSGAGLHDSRVVSLPEVRSSDGVWIRLVEVGSALLLSIGRWTAVPLVLLALLKGF